MNFQYESLTFYDEYKDWKLPIKNLKNYLKKISLCSFQPNNFKNGISTPLGGEGFKILVTIPKNGKNEVAQWFLIIYGC